MSNLIKVGKLPRTELVSVVRKMAHKEPSPKEWRMFFRDYENKSTATDVSPDGEWYRAEQIREVRQTLDGLYLNKPQRLEYLEKHGVMKALDKLIASTMEAV